MKNKIFSLLMVGFLVIPSVSLTSSWAVTQEEQDTEDSTPREIGDALQIVLPGIAFGTTLVLRDWQGFGQMLGVTAAQVFTIGSLKLLVSKRRPDDGDRKSYPSGHTAGAFSGAAFVHYRYGWKWGVPMYIGAVYTGYSRVYADKHWTADVWTGGAIATLWAWYITTPYQKNKNLSFYPDLQDGYSGIRMRYVFGGAEEKPEHAYYSLPSEESNTPIYSYSLSREPETNPLLP